jgi:tetratricopeptide (TPR) repeat protein
MGCSISLLESWLTLFEAACSNKLTLHPPLTLRYKTARRNMNLRHISLATLLISLSLAAPTAALRAQATTPIDHPVADPEKPAATPPEKPAESALQPGAKPDYSKEAFVTERLQERYRFENDGTGRKVATLRIHVLSEAGVQGFGQLRFGYNSANDRMEIGYVRVTKSDGTVVTAGPDAVQDLSSAVQQIAPVYTDYREKHVTVPGLRPGDTLECEVTTIFHTALAPGQFWTQHDFNRSSIVLDEELEIDIPASRTVKLKTKPGFDAKISEENGRRIYHWSSSHLVHEDNTKTPDKSGTKKKNRKTEEASDVQMTTFASWEEVGHWYAGLEKDRRTPSKEVRAKAEALTKGLNSDLEKTEALYDFVAQNFRYVSLSLGLARYQPQAAADVLHNQYGDCKDKNTLLAALLEAEGLHSSSVLINSFRKLDPDVPSPSQFNHVVTMLPLGKEEIWMDTTTEVAPFRLLAFSLRKKQALVVTPNAVPHLEETPADPPMPDKELEEIAGKVDETGHLDGTVTFTMRGDSEVTLRNVFRHTAAAQWQKSIEVVNKGLGGDVSNVKVSDPVATREPFTFSYQVSKANFVDWSKKKLQLKLPLSYWSPASVSADVGEEDEDDPSNTENFKLGAPNEHTYRLKLELAPRFHADAPLPVALDRDYAAYQSTYTVAGPTFTAERKLTMRLAELPPARADDYRAFRRSVLADEAQSLAIESSVADTHFAPTNMKTSDLIRSGNEARRNGNYGLAVELLNRAVEADPKNRTAWNDLGLVYFDDQQEKLAINAFQEQIAVNPFDESAYNNLGRVYMRERKYDEADKWFRKQIDVNPLDKYAHANLGLSLMEQHKYEDAVPELEKAAAVRPDNAHPQVNLGTAYLNLGQDEKAMAAFDKAVTISATPAIWNSIAYQLSLKKAHLDRARSYAESAVSATAAALRNVSLDQVNRRDPALTSSLATYWDTLGWVGFADGQLDVAERYVSAAWQLSGSADTADHLGQIYEKRGKKEDAVRLYALAMNARRPEPETRTRLAALIGGDDKVEAMVAKHRDDQQHERTLQLPNAAKLDGRAEFFVLLAPGQASAVAVEGAAFLEGDEKLKTFTEVLRSASFSQKLPDETPVKILRRGTLSCKSDGGCVFLLALPDDVKSAD